MALDFREVFARHWKAYFKLHGARIPAAHRQAAEAILACRTPALGGNLYRCENCGDPHFAYHSCNHRLCPLCGQESARDWAHAQKAKLLPVPYSLVTFTVPQTLRELFRAHQQLCYALLFECSAKALQELAAEPKYLGASLGFVSVLQTWSRQLIYHPHIHIIVPEGGLTPSGGWVRSKYPEYFLPVAKLSIKMRILMEKACQRKAPELYASVPRSVWRENWNTQIEAGGNGQHAIEYLGRYVSQSALSANQIVAEDGRSVKLLYTESKTGLRKTLPLDGCEFIRRFLQHVLPTGFKRVRYYGWLSPAAHRRFARIQALLDWKPAITQRQDKPEPPQCRVCGKALILVTTWKRGRAPPPIVDISKPLYA